MDETRALRCSVLEACGASGTAVDELLAYNENPFAAAPDPAALALPLPDEAHIESWVAYEADAAQLGAIEALRRRFVQLRFPVRTGLSTEEPYRSATLRGRFAEADAFAPGLALGRPSAIDLAIYQTIAGRIPVLTVGERRDFELLVQAFTERNEPVHVPDAMGACIVTGLNNWDRIAAYRAAWERTHAGPTDEDAWLQEFRNLIPRKALYQDRFIILSRGPYSAVSGQEIGIDEQAWLTHSLVIRREHEFTHYFTYRVFGAMRNNVLDELIADFVGLVRAFGTYKPDLALRFLGLEAYPAYRQGGRLETYRGKPPLSDEAFQVLGRLAVRAARNLEGFSDGHRDHLTDLASLARAVFALVGLSLEELASTQMPSRVAERMR